VLRPVFGNKSPVALPASQHSLSLGPATGCIRANSGTRSLRAATREVEIDYPVAFADAIRPMLARNQQPFRYMHVSGVMAEKDQEKPLWFLQDGRRAKVRTSPLPIASFALLQVNKSNINLMVDTGTSRNQDEAACTL